MKLFSRRSISGGAALVWFAMAAVPAVADPLYGITNFRDDSLTNLNNSGQVVYAEGGQSYLYNSYGPSAGQVTSLGTIGGPPSSTVSSDFTWPTEVNDAGQVVGGARAPAAGGTHHAFLSQNGTMTDLGTLPGAGISFATGINDPGQVTGYAYLGPGGVTIAHTFLYSGGTMTDLGTFGHSESYAQAINDQGQVAGDVYDGTVSHGFFYSNGKETDIGSFGGPSSFVNAINNAGQLVGGATLAGGQATHAFIFSNGMLQDLGTLGGISSWATGINDAGQVVGLSTTSDGVLHPFLYSSGKMVDLNSLIAQNSDWSLGAANINPKINDAGQIIVAATDPNSKTANLLLTPSDLPTPPDPPMPIPEPSTLGVFALAAISGGARRLWLRNSSSEDPAGRA